MHIDLVYPRHPGAAPPAARGRTCGWCGSHISASRVVDGMLVRCTLCGMVFDDADPLIDQRKRRHIQWHDPASTSRRRNMVAGRVSWDPA